MRKNISATKISTSVIRRLFEELAQPPMELFFKGKSKILENQTIAFVSIVGSRNPTPYGIEATRNIVRFLANHNVCVVSGMALGIDAVALTEAIKEGVPAVAVLPSDVQKPYPRTNYSLAQKIVENEGLLLSEYHQNPKPAKHHFLARNRLVAALGDILIVPEARQKSGTAHTVRHALELGHDVMAVPGSIFSELSSGCNNYIKGGAHPLCSMNDIIELLPKLKHSTQLPAALHTRLNASEAAVLDLVRSHPLRAEQIVEKTGLLTEIVLATLTELELKGMVTVSGGLYHGRQY